MALALVVGLAGGAGAVARYLADGAVQDRTAGPFPFGTLTVNLVGSFVLGIVAGVVLRHGGPGALESIAGTGFCGGLTTWSTASWETVRLAQEGEVVTALGYTLANLAASLALAALGLLIVWF
jgi:fluoride exporter